MRSIVVYDGRSWLSRPQGYGHEAGGLWHGFGGDMGSLVDRSSQLAHSFCALEALVLLKHCHFARELRPDRHVLARRSVGYGHDSTLVVSAGRLACPRRWPEHGCSFGLTWRALMLLVNKASRRIVSSLSTWLGGARSASEEVCVVSTSDPGECGAERRMGVCRKRAMAVLGDTE